jgi:hypothetical protein
MNPIAKRGVTVLIAATVVLGLLTAALAQQPQPQIVIPKMLHDLGSVFEQDKYEYTFVVQNTGKADLVIDNVKPG